MFIPQNQKKFSMTTQKTMVLIGAGRVATHLSRALSRAGVRIVQVYSRTQESASALAGVLHTAFTTDLEALVSDADYYLFSVKDAVLADLVAALAPRCGQGCFLHTAGSVPLSVFEGHGLSRYGVLYPLQTFSHGRALDLSAVPVFVEASSPSLCEELTALASSFSRSVYPLSSAARRKLHLSAVFACNFVNHCYALAGSLLAEEQIPFEALLPLIDETAAKVHQLPPAEAQTGPAVRYDRNVLDAQMAQLQDRPLYRDIYELMSRSIHQEAQKHNPEK